MGARPHTREKGGGKPSPSPHTLFALLLRSESPFSLLSKRLLRYKGYGIRGNVACEHDLLHCMSSLI